MNYELIVLLNIFFIDSDPGCKQRAIYSAIYSARSREECKHSGSTSAPVRSED